MQRRWRVMAVVSVAVFMASLDLFIVNIAFAGAVLGVAILVAVLSSPPDWQAGWVAMTIVAVVAGAASLAIGEVRPHVAVAATPVPSAALGR